MSSTPNDSRPRRSAARHRSPARRLLDPLFGLIRWIVAHVRGFWAAAGLFLGAGLGLALLSAAVFALLARWMAGGLTQELDQGIIDWMRAREAPWLDGLALIGAALGSGMATWIVLGAGSLLFWLTGHHLSALLLWLSLVGGRLLSAELKELFDRPRPSATGWDLEIFGQPIGFPSSGSFPSGHAVTSVIVFGTLAYLVVRLEPAVRLRRLTLAAAAALILLIGVSRIYLGVHYPSDVLAGYLAGFIWATFSAFTIELIRYFRLRRPEIAREEKDLDEGMQPVSEALQGDGG